MRLSKVVSPFLVVSACALALPPTPLDPFLFLQGQWSSGPESNRQPQGHTRSSTASYEWALGYSYFLGKHKTFITRSRPGGSDTLVEEYWNFIRFDDTREHVILRQLGRGRDVHYILDASRSTRARFVFLSDAFDCYSCESAGVQLRYTLEATAQGGFSETLEFLNRDGHVSGEAPSRFTRASTVPPTPSRP